MVSFLFGFCFIFQVFFQAFQALFGFGDILQHPASIAEESDGRGAVIDDLHGEFPEPEPEDLPDLDRLVIEGEPIDRAQRKDLLG